MNTEIIRVLIVSDDVSARHRLAYAVERDPSIRIVGVATGDVAAQATIPRVRPDVVLLDLDLPETTSFRILTNTQSAHPLLPIIVLSPRSRSGATAVLQALELGAAEFITKPDRNGVSRSISDHLRKRLVTTIKTMGRAGCHRPMLPGQEARPRTVEALGEPRTRSARRRVDVVVIGADTGGPAALSALLPHFPANFPVPVLIVQHMPKYYTAALAEWLALKSKIPVVEGFSGAPLEPRCAWVAPGGLHTTIRRADGLSCIQTYRGLRKHNSRPSIDVLFHSAAESYGPHVLAVVLSGGSRDGVEGCAHVHEAGGQILVQDEADALVWESPGSVVRAHLADQVLPLQALGQEILRRVPFDGLASALDAAPAKVGGFATSIGR